MIKKKSELLNFFGEPDDSTATIEQADDDDFSEQTTENRKYIYSEWKNMPEYNNEKQKEPEITVKFKFRNKEDFEQFNELLKKHVYKNNKVFDGMQKITEKQAWFPLKEKESNYTYITESPVNPQFPIYVVSKGRWKRRPTCTTLDEMGIPYKVLVEPEEYEQYCSAIGADKVMAIPEKYKLEYDTFWKDEDKRTGPGHARNFAWDDSIKNGFSWHWVMDDNIESFKRFNNSTKIICLTGAIFKSCEDFSLRYDNLAISGLNYDYFCPSYDARPPFRLNTRIYSCMLIRNDIPYRWRGRYNEDTDLSLRALKDGWCTVQFNMALQEKRATQTMRGGNSESFYDEEGTLKKSKMLHDMHPDVAKVVWRFNRWHHYVNYNIFKKNKLIKKQGLIIPETINNYGMKVISSNTEKDNKTVEDI